MAIKKNFVIDDWMLEYLEFCAKKHNVKSLSKVLRSLISCYVICVADLYEKDHNPDYNCDDMMEDLNNAINQKYKGGINTMISNFEFYGRIAWEHTKKLNKKKRTKSKDKPSTKLL